MTSKMVIRFSDRDVWVDRIKAAIEAARFTQAQHRAEYVKRYEETNWLVRNLLMDTPTRYDLIDEFNPIIRLKHFLFLLESTYWDEWVIDSSTYQWILDYAGPETK